MRRGILGPVYVAGPMRDIDAYNFPAFHAAAERLRKEGVDVVDPAELDEAEPFAPGSMPVEYYKRRDLRALLRCNTVAVLSGWEGSEGATLEVFVARALGMRVLDAQTLDDLQIDDDSDDVDM